MVAFEKLTEDSGIVDSTTWTNASNLDIANDLQDDYVTPVVRLDKKKHLIKDAESEEEVFNLNSIVTTRKIVALQRFLYLNEKQLTQMGVQMPLQMWGSLLSYAGPMAMSFIKDVITSEKVKEMMTKGFSAAKQYYNTHEGTKGRVVKSFATGVAAAAGFNKASKIVDKVAKQGPKALIPGFKKALVSLKNGNLKGEMYNEVVDAVCTIGKKYINRWGKELAPLIKDIQDIRDQADPQHNNKQPHTIEAIAKKYFPESLV